MAFMDDLIISVRRTMNLKKERGINMDYNEGGNNYGNY